MRITIPINLRDNEETLIVEYEENSSPYQSGFDALNVPFSINDCIGYPTIHAFFQDMNAAGYKRYCGFIQFVQTAFTYLVDMPTRMNHNKLSYITGFSWGYEEDETGCVKIQDFKLVSKEQFSIHYKFLLKQFPNFRNGHNL